MGIAQGTQLITSLFNANARKLHVF